MSVSFDRPSTWVPFTSARLCDGCSAACCSLPVEATPKDLVRLGVLTEDEAAGSMKKAFRKLHAEGVVRSYHAPSGQFILEQRHGRDCVYLDPKSRRCTVYERRPDVCREFPKIGPRPGFCPKRKIGS
jgi:Fe-S-cluster containining protein